MYAKVNAMLCPMANPMWTEISSTSNLRVVVGIQAAKTYWVVAYLIPTGQGLGAEDLFELNGSRLWCPKAG